MHKGMLYNIIFMVKLGKFVFSSSWAITISEATIRGGIELPFNFKIVKITK